MKNNNDLIQKINNKELLNYIIYFDFGDGNWYNVSSYVYKVNINYTDFKIDFTPSTATCQIDLYAKNQSITNLIRLAVEQKKLKVRVFTNTNPTEILFEGYIDYPTFVQEREGFNSNIISLEFFDYTYILKTKKIGRIEVESGKANGGNNNSIILDNDASNISDYYNYMMIEITSGNGITQERVIIDYDGITHTAYVDRHWDTIPDTTSYYSIKRKLKFINNYKCNNSDKNRSMLHQIMYTAGFNDSYISVNDILTIPQIVVFEEEETCFDALKSLFQSELMIFDFTTGKLRAKSIDTTEVVPVFTLNNTLNKPNKIFGRKEIVKSANNNYKSIRATFDTIIQDNIERILFSLQDKQNGWESSELGRISNCYILLRSGTYYPSNGELIEATLKFNDTCDVIYADDIRVEIETYESYYGRQPRIILSDFQINGGNVKFRLYNNTSGDDYLLSFKIFGKAIYIRETQTYVEGDTTDKESLFIDKNWFFVNLNQCKRLINFYKYILIDIAKYEYEINTDLLLQLEIGDIINVKLATGFEFLGLIKGINHSIEINELQRTSLTIIPVAQFNYNPSNVRSVSYVINSPYTVSLSISELLANQIIENTLYQISNEEGTNIGGFTNEPAPPTFTKIMVSSWTINLYWNYQHNLSNFDRYQIQYSKDLQNWYSFDNILNAYTNVYQENITFIGEITIDEATSQPLGQGYYFRIRRLTKDGKFSNWSTPAFATTNPIGYEEGKNNGLIYVNSNNFWDLVNSKFRIGNNNKYIYFDGDNIYFRSIFIDITTSDLITYNETRTIRMRLSGTNMNWETGENYSDLLAKLGYDEEDNTFNILNKTNNINIKDITSGELAKINASGLILNDNDILYKDGSNNIIQDTYAKNTNQSITYTTSNISNFATPYHIIDIKNYNNSVILYVSNINKYCRFATNTGRLYRINDAGTSWQEINSNYLFERVILDPNNVLYCLKKEVEKISNILYIRMYLYRLENNYTFSLIAQKEDTYGTWDNYRVIFALAFLNTGIVFGYGFENYIFEEDAGNLRCYKKIYDTNLNLKYNTYQTEDYHENRFYFLPYGQGRGATLYVVSGRYYYSGNYYIKIFNNNITELTYTDKNYDKNTTYYSTNYDAFYYESNVYKWLDDDSSAFHFIKYVEDINGNVLGFYNLYRNIYYKYENGHKAIHTSNLSNGYNYDTGNIINTFQYIRNNYICNLASSSIYKFDFQNHTFIVDYDNKYITVKQNNITKYTLTTQEKINNVFTHTQASKNYVACIAKDRLYIYCIEDNVVYNTPFSETPILTIIGANFYVTSSNLKNVNLNILTAITKWKLGAGIIEEGSNANGKWLKFSNGTMIVYDIPASFSSTGWSTGNYNIGSYGWSFYYKNITVSLPIELPNTNFMPFGFYSDSTGFEIFRVRILNTTTITVSLQTYHIEARNVKVGLIGRWL